VKIPTFIHRAVDERRGSHVVNLQRGRKFASHFPPDFSTVEGNCAADLIVGPGFRQAGDDPGHSPAIVSQPTIAKQQKTQPMA
jgi:hypothetical protein